MRYRLAQALLWVMRRFGYDVVFELLDDDTIHLEVTVPSLKRGMWWIKLCTEAVSKAINEHPR